MKIGSHVSISKGLIGAAMEAASYGANTFMVYTGAPQNTKRQPVENMKIEQAHTFMKNNDIEEFVVHAPYIINLASFKNELYGLAKTFLSEELRRTSLMGSNYLVLHPGSYTEKDLEYGVSRITGGLNEVLKNDIPVMVLLETMSGKGSEIGKNFEELKMIHDNIQCKEKLGFCLDTCHVHDSGYDIINNLDEVLDEFDNVLGLENLKVLHINGSLNEIGAKKDRHANIGADETNPKGKDRIGFNTIYKVVSHEKLKGKIFILETPWLDSKTNLYKKEIESLRSGVCQ